MKNIYTSPKGKFVGFLKMVVMVLVLVGSGVKGWGQVNIPNTTVITQNFDGMAATLNLPTNWRIQGTATPTWAAGSTVVTQQASTGLPVAGGTYNWGAGASDRALGAMTSGGFASPNSVMAWFRNTNTSNLTSLTIDYDLERYRINSAAASLTFFYSINGSTWTSIPAGDIAAASLPTGTSSYDYAPTGVPSATNTGVISRSGIIITGLNIATNGDIYLRWNLNTTGGNSQGIGIDNFNLVAAFTASCSPPTTQTSLLSTSTQTTDGFSANWTAGNGNGTMLVVRPTAQALLAPTSGTSYTPSLAWATAAQINTNNRVVFRSAGTSAGPLTGLTAGTQYTATAYEYNTLGECYNTSSPPSSSIFTLSTEPTSHATTFNCNASAFNQIDVSFAAASTTAGNGYIILQKNGSAPTGTPSDATAYIIGATIGDATVAAVVNSAAATTQSITSLTATTNYFYSIIPFNWDGTNAATYNYRIAATIPSTNCTTLAQPSSLSDIVFNSASTASINTNIGYSNYQSVTISNTGSGAGGSIGVMGFIVRDGGAAGSDADVLPTILTGISFSVTNVANIRSAALFNGTTFIATVAVSGISPITFSGLSGANVTCADDGTLSLNLRVTFNTAVTDNQKMVFTIATATAASGSTSSLFSALNAGGAISENTAGDINRIEVTADRLAFLQGPSGATNGIAMSPAITVRAIDVNANTDFDFANNITLSCSIPAALSSGANSTAVSGVSTFSSVIHGIDGTYTMVASATGLTSTGNSGSYVISSVANGTWRTANGSSTALWSSTAASSTVTWERMVTGSWVLQTLPTQPPTSGSLNTVIIRHEVTLAGTNTHKDIIIANGGILNTNTVAATFGSLLVQTGGIFNRQGSVTFDVTGTLEIEDGATFTFKQTNGNSRTNGIWAGTEKFHKNSNFEVVFSDNVTLTILEAPNDVSLYTDGISTACFGNVIINCGSGSMQLIPIGFGTAGSPKQLTHQDLIFRANSDPKFAEGAYNAIIGRDLIIESGYNQTITLATTAVTATMSVLGNFVNNSTRVFRLLNNAAGNVTLNVDGDMSINSTGSIDFNFANGGVATINLKGDLAVVSTALLSANATTVANNTFNFIGTGNGLTVGTTQTLSIASNGGTRNQYVNFNVAIGAYVQLINQNLELGINSTFVVIGSAASTGGTLDFNFNGSNPLNITSVTSGTRFGLGSITGTNSGGRLKISSPDGISSTSGSIGNVQVTNAPQYNSVSTFHYVGKIDQVTGTGLPTASSGKLVIVELLDNTKTLSLTASTGISNNTTLDALGGKLEIKKGIVIGTTTTDFSGGGRLVMSDGEYRISTITATPLTNYLPQLTNYSNYSLTGGIVHLNGANALQILSGTPNYFNLSFSGSNILGTDYKGLSNATSVSNNISIEQTAIVDVKDRSLGGNTTNFNMLNNSRYITDGGGTKPDAGGTYSLGTNTTIDFACTTGAGSIRLGAPLISYAKVIVSGTNVSNTSTTTGINFQPSGTLLVKNAATFKLLNTAGFSNTTGSVATAISNVAPSNPTITLEPNSTIEYAGAAQTITNAALLSPITGNYYNLTLSGTGIKTAPATNLVLLGDLYSAGTHTFDANASRVLFSNSSAQKYYAAVGTPVIDFYNLTNNNSSATGLSVDASFGVQNEFNLMSTSKLFLNTGDVIMRSSNNRTSYLVDLGTTLPSTNITYGSGRFEIERYLFGKRAWRLLATPIDPVGAPSILNSWQEGGSMVSTGYGTQISGPTGGTGLDFTTVRGSLKWFEAAIQTYNEIENTNDAIARTEGYYVFVRGDRAQGVSATAGFPTNLRIKGKILTGTQTAVPIPGNSFISWGNPYPSAIDFRNVARTSSADAFTVWNPLSAGSYNLGAFETYVKDTDGHYKRVPYGTFGNIRDTIMSGEAIFLQNNTAIAGSVTAEENDKVAGSRNVSRDDNTVARDGVTIPTLEINLHTNDVNGNSFLADGVLLNFNNSFSNALDNLDVRKINNTADNIFIKSNTKNLVVERRSNLTTTDTIQLNLTNTRIANYYFEIDPSILSNTGLNAFLKDKFLQTETPVSFTSVTNVPFAITADAASKVADRFMIVFRQGTGGPLPVTFVSIHAAKNANKTNSIKWNVSHEINIQQYEVERSDRGINFVSIGNTAALNNTGGSYAYHFIDAAPLHADNYYRIKSTSFIGEVKYSAIVKVSADVALPSISIYPNPVEDKLIKIHFAANAGKYAVSLLNAAGKRVYTKNMIVVSDNEIQTIEVNKSLVAGNYSLVLIQQDGSKKLLPIVVL